MKAKPFGRWWRSDVTPFEYMQALAQMWGRTGTDFAAGNGIDHHLGVEWRSGEDEKEEDGF